MKNNLKKILFERFEANMIQNYPDMSEANRRKIAALMQNIAIDIIQENTDGLSSAYVQSINDLEVHKKKFREHIELLQKEVKKMFDIFKAQGFIRVDYDSKTKKPILKARTSMVTDMVNLLNALNVFVMDFYENVYKIGDEEYPTGIQTTLF